MIGMEMGDDDARDGLAFEARREDLLPQGFHFDRVNARIDQCPAVVFLDQPEIDVGQLKRQRHSHPVNAGRGLHHFAGLRNARERIAQRGSVICGKRNVGHFLLLSVWRIKEGAPFCDRRVTRRRQTER